MFNLDGTRVKLAHVPTSLRNKMCVCYGYPTYTEGSKPMYDYSGRVPKCVACSKSPSYLFRTCSSCKKGFLRNFSHPAQCWKTEKNMCWDCCEEQGDVNCDCFPEGAATHYYNREKKAPAGYLTKEMRENADTSFFGELESFSF